MLEGLDKVDWAKVNVVDAAKIMRDLAAESYEYEEAFHKINNFFQKERNCEFAIRLYPFLIELLNRESTRHKLDILALLMMWVYRPPQYECEERAFHVFSQGIDSYLMILRNSEDYDRRDIMAALSLNKKFARKTVPVLCELIEQGCKPLDEIVRYLGEAVFESGEFEEEQSKYISLFARLVDTQNNLVASQWLVRILGDKAPLKATTIVNDYDKYVKEVEKRRKDILNSWN
jgi:hypothetical protein